MSYQHLTINERTKIETLFHLGWTARAIARHIQRHHSTVSRELNRVNSLSTTYLAVEAQEDYQHRRTQSKPKGKWTKIREHYLTQKLAATWSPEQIQGRLKHEYPELNVAFKTIYRWIYQGKLVKGNTSFLRHKGKRRKPRENRGRFNLGLSINQWPKEVKHRQTFGHRELDTAVKMSDRSVLSMEHSK